MNEQARPSLSFTCGCRWVQTDHPVKAVPGAAQVVAVPCEEHRLVTFVEYAEDYISDEIARWQALYAPQAGPTP